MWTFALAASAASTSCPRRHPAGVPCILAHPLLHPSHLTLYRRSLAFTASATIGRWPRDDRGLASGPDAWASSEYSSTETQHREDGVSHVHGLDKTRQQDNKTNKTTRQTRQQDKTTRQTERCVYEIQDPISKTNNPRLPTPVRPLRSTSLHLDNMHAVLLLMVAAAAVAAAAAAALAQAGPAAAAAPLPPASRQWPPGTRAPPLPPCRPPRLNGLIGLHADRGASDDAVRT